MVDVKEEILLQVKTARLEDLGGIRTSSFGTERAPIAYDDSENSINSYIKLCFITLLPKYYVVDPEIGRL